MSRGRCHSWEAFSKQLGATTPTKDLTRASSSCARINSTSSCHSFRPARDPAVQALLLPLLPFLPAVLPAAVCLPVLPTRTGPRGAFVLQGCVRSLATIVPVCSTGRRRADESRRPTSGAGAVPCISGLVPRCSHCVVVDQVTVVRRGAPGAR